MKRTERDEQIAKVIQERCGEVRQSPRAVSLAIGCCTTYLHQYFSGKQKQLPEASLRSIARVLSLDYAQLLEGRKLPLNDNAQGAPGVTGSVPVFAAGDDVDPANPRQFANRPPSLATAMGAWALFGSARHGRLRAGDVAFVHPHQTPRVGDMVVVLDNLKIVATGELLDAPDGAYVVEVSKGEPESFSEEDHRLQKITAIEMA